MKIHIGKLVLNLGRTVNINPSSSQFVIYSSLIITLVFDYPFISKVYESVQPNTLWEWVFFVSIPILLTLINILFVSVFGAVFFPRITIAFTFLVCAFLFYASVVYGVIFDSSMLQNIVETNSGEALSYLNISFLLFFILLGMLPVFAVLNQEIKGGFTSRIKKLLLINLVALLGIILIAGLFYKSYAAVGRNNKGLIKHIIPYAFYDAGYKYLRDTYFYPPLPYRVLDKHPVINDFKPMQPRTLVVVVGETARADKFGSNGYYRNTTPNLQRLGAVSFNNVTSCGTATAVSVPCMFSRLPRKQYDSRIASSQDNVLDIIHRAGTAVTWIDNNSSCKGVCSRIDSVAFDPHRDPTLCDGDFCLDEILVNQLNRTLKEYSSSNRVVILHMIGSHGPTYYRRYPENYGRYQPDCPRSDIQNCTAQALNNTYDNTIAYTDYVLGKVIGLLANVPNSAMLYISDHGESLGEKGLYLHGFPYKLAPAEQTHVPMVYWDSNLGNTAYKRCVAQRVDNPYSQDNLYDTLLGLTAVNSVTYQANLDIFSPCKI